VAGKEADVGPDSFGLLDGVVAAEMAVVGAREDSGEHAKGGGFCRRVAHEKTVKSCRLAGEAKLAKARISRASCPGSAGQAAGFNNRRTPSWEFVRQGTEG